MLNLVSEQFVVGKSIKEEVVASIFQVKKGLKFKYKYNWEQTEIDKPVYTWQDDQSILQFH